MQLQLQQQLFHSVLMQSYGLTTIADIGASTSSMDEDLANSEMGKNFKSSLLCFVLCFINSSRQLSGTDLGHLLDRKCGQLAYSDG